MLRQMEQAVCAAVDLPAWRQADAQARSQMLQGIFQAAQRHLPANIRLALTMPKGYESAYGLYDPLSQRLSLNADLLHEGGVDALFYFLHELRHGMQYQHPTLFSPEIQESLPYVIQYDGQCFQLSDGAWQQTALTGEDFPALYLSLPYELDANEFALACLSRCHPEPEETARLQSLRSLWLPDSPAPIDALRRIFRRIDAAL